MGRISALILTLFLFAVLQVNAQFEKPVLYQSSAIEEVVVTNTNNGKNGGIPVSSYTTPLMLFIFLSPECPLTQQYSLQLNELASLYKNKVKFIGIFPGKSYDRETIVTFLRKYNITFPTFIDQSKNLSHYFTASVTPEVILLGNQKNLMNLQYRGAVDDRVKELGVKRLKATSYFIKDAIEQSLKNKEVVIKRTDPVGCLINDF